MWNFKKDIFRTGSSESGFEINLCYDTSYSGACYGCTNIEFDPFDFMVIRFLYEKPINGTDLDIFIRYMNTGTVEDGVPVGFNYNTITPPGSLPENSYLWWASDDVSTPSGPSVEAVVLGAKNFETNYPLSNNTLEVPLRVGWYGGRGDGNLNIELVTYSGGSMSLSGTNIINTGGVIVNSQAATTNVVTVPGQVTESHSDLIGTVIYDKITKTASLTIQ